ncbi:HAMP domain-containing sensor histidine kinase [Amycolatopsis minnesotensis]|uniref:histidine kinase n=1 Tax=Amycolatopsis minnesotensis TaxID=337894 RepID=A0ABP5BLT3_9PSEU
MVCGLALAVPVVEALQAVLGTFVYRDFCPRGVSCAHASPPMFLRLAALIALAVVLWWARRFVRRWVLRPLPDLTTTINQLGPQNLGQRMRPEDLEGPLRSLAVAVNGLMDRVALAFDGQRRFAANASHELRTPLAVQRTLLEVAVVTGDGKDAEVNRLAAQLLAVNERNERLIEGLLVLAEADRGLPGTVPVRLDELVDSVLTAHAERLAEHDLILRRNLAARTVPADPVLLERLIGNLVLNAIKYNEPGGWVEVVVADEPALLVRNSGQRVPAESVAALFQPFRRLTADRMSHRDGVGLGLSIVRSIAAAHDGTVSATPGREGGLRVEVGLPRADPG